MLELLLEVFSLLWESTPVRYSLTCRRRLSLAVWLLIHAGTTTSAT